MVELTKDLIKGFVGSCLLKGFDGSKPIPEFHEEMWDLCCSKHKFIAIAAPRHHAKAESLDSKILTPTGWSTIGALKVGDTIIGGDGKPAKVTQLHPITEMDLYRIQTVDGKSALCNLGHLWNVEIPSNKKGIQVKSLEEILTNWKTTRKKTNTREEHTEYRYRIPAIKPVQYNENQFSIDPYTLGVWLGDGHSNAGIITSADPEIFNYIPYKSIKRECDTYGYTLEGFHKDLKQANLLNNKYIPKEYFLGSINQRLALLQGLMDTDGTCHKQHGQVSFCNTNYNLIEGVVDLVRSLGGIASISTGLGKYSGKTCKQYWKVSIKLGEGLCPFKLKRKKILWKPSKSLYSYICKIEKETTALGRCISVERDTYITDDYLLTHNSTAITLSYTLASVLFRAKRFVVIVSDSEYQASMFLGQIKQALQENEDIIKLFHIRKNDKGLVEFVKETETDIIVACEDGYKFRIIARGSEQKMRGLLWDGTRPDLFVLDDMESDEQVMNKERRDKFRRWFYGALIPALSENGQIRYVGTILHQDSMLENLMPRASNPFTVTEDLKQYTTRTVGIWKSVKYRAHTGDFSKILWSDKWPKEKLIEFKEDYHERGLPEQYSQEFLNVPIDESVAYFKRKDFAPEIQADKEKALNYYIAGDFAVSEKERADYTVFVVGGMDEDGILHIRNVVRGRMAPDEIIETMLGLQKVYDPIAFAIEETQITKSLGPFLNRAMIESGIFINLFPMKPHKTDKQLRAQSIRARMRAGGIKFDKDTDWYNDLEDEMTMFPRSRHDDQVDALAYLGLLIDKLVDAPTKEEKEDEDYLKELEEFGFNDQTKNFITGY